MSSMVFCGSPAWPGCTSATPQPNCAADQSAKERRKIREALQGLRHARHKVQQRSNRVVGAKLEYELVHVTALEQFDHAGKILVRCFSHVAQ